MRTYDGCCHCGAIAFSYVTELTPTEWSVRACQCSFCRAHGAVCTSDPNGSVRFYVNQEKTLQRYTFGTHSADFLICGTCGVYVAAVMTMEGRSFTTVNLRTLRAMVPELPEPEPMSYESESYQERIDRRRRRWTPVEGVG